MIKYFISSILYQLYRNYFLSKKTIIVYSAESTDNVNNFRFGTKIITLKIIPNYFDLLSYTQIYFCRKDYI